MIEAKAKGMKKDSYKKTRLGWIPEEWQVKRLSDLTSKIGSGTTPKGGSKVYTTKGHPFIRSQNIGWGRLLLEDIAYISDDIHNSMSSTELQMNDVLLNITGASIGRSALVTKKIDKGNVNQHVCIIRVNKSVLDERFLNIFLISRGGQKQIEMLQAGGNRQGLNFQQIGLFKIPLPSMYEQKNIVGVISSWDEAISKTEKLIQAKKRYKKGLMQRLLSPSTSGQASKVRFPEFEGEDWVEVKLGKFFKPFSTKNKENEDLPVLSCSKVHGITLQSNIFDKRVASKDIKRYKVVERDDLIYDPMLLWDASIGFLKEEDRGVISPAYNTFKFKEKSGYRPFFEYLFDTHYMRYNYQAISQGTNRRRRKAPAEAFLGIDIKVPKSKEEQRKIATVLGALTKEIELLKKEITLYQKQKKGLMQQLLTGKVRVS